MSYRLMSGTKFYYWSNCISSECETLVYVTVFVEDQSILDDDNKMEGYNILTWILTIKISVNIAMNL